MSRPKTKCLCQSESQVSGMVLDDYKAAGRFLSRNEYPAWFGPMAFHRYITNGGGFWFHYQGIPVGVGILNPRLSSLGALAVAKEHRGHGLGTAIVEFLQPNFVRAVEDKVLYFEKLGFVPVGKMKKGIRLKVQVMCRKSLFHLAGRLKKQLVRASDS